MADNKFVKSISANIILFHDPILPEGGIGVDPGLNLGLAYIYSPTEAHTLSVRVDRSEASSTELLNVFHNVPLLMLNTIYRKTPVVVEGAAHNARYGQPLLGAIRGALILAFDHAGYETVVEMPPLQIRKKVYGDGSIQPKDFWQIKDHKGFNKDAADALSMAIAAGS